MKLTKDVVGVIAGEIYPRTFAAGTECPDDLVDAAQSAGAIDVEKKAQKRAPENK